MRAVLAVDRDVRAAQRLLGVGLAEQAGVIRRDADGSGPSWLATALRSSSLSRITRASAPRSRMRWRSCQRQSFQSVALASGKKRRRNARERSDCGERGDALALLDGRRAVLWSKLDLRGLLDCYGTAKSKFRNLARPIKPISRGFYEPVGQQIRLATKAKTTLALNHRKKSKWCFRLPSNLQGIQVLFVKFSGLWDGCDFFCFPKPLFNVGFVRGYEKITWSR